MSGFPNAAVHHPVVDQGELVGPDVPAPLKGKQDSVTNADALRQFADADLLNLPVRLNQLS
jgi:hypothetical protein